MEMMQTYLIPVTWEVLVTMEIEAESLEKAEELALGDFPLPTDGETDYIDDSIQLDKDHHRYGEVC